MINESCENCKKKGTKECELTNYPLVVVCGKWEQVIGVDAK